MPLPYLCPRPGRRMSLVLRSCTIVRSRRSRHVARRRLPVAPKTLRQRRQAGLADHGWKRRFSESGWKLRWRRSDRMPIRRMRTELEPPRGRVKMCQSRLILLSIPGWQIPIRWEWSPALRVVDPQVPAVLRQKTTAGACFNTARLLQICICSVWLHHNFPSSIPTAAVRTPPPDLHPDHSDLKSRPVGYFSLKLFKQWADEFPNPAAPKAGQVDVVLLSLHLVVVLLPIHVHEVKFIDEAEMLQLFNGSIPLLCKLSSCHSAEVASLAAETARWSVW